MQPREASHQPRFVFLIGPSGSGKTVLSAELGRLLECPPIDTDALIEARDGRPISEIFESNGEAYFRRLECEIVDRILADGGRGVVATGGGLPTIEGMMDRLSQAGITVYLRASLDELWNRLSVDRAELAKRPLLRKNGRAGLREMLRRRQATYDLAQLTVTTDGMSVDAIAKKVFRVVTEYLAIKRRS